MPEAGARDSASLLLCGMQFAVFERQSDAAFRTIAAPPSWFLLLTQTMPEPGDACVLTDHFPALEGFLPVAEEHWAAASSGPLQSDFWSETDSAGHDYHLLAFAVTADGHHFLVIERADATYTEHQQLQLYAHEMVIQYDTIAHLNKEVERATQAKTDFLASMSHEIRTPLNAILGMADLLAETSLDAGQRKYVEVFQRAGANLLSLINDILDLSKVEAGQMELEAIDFELAEVLHRALDLTRTRASAKGLGIEASIAVGLPPMLIGDPLRLRQVLLNLLGNAMKFTESGRLDIEVTADPTDATPGALLFRVRDTGIGIPEDKLGSIFENFSQVDTSTTRKYGGTGLGLAISKRIVELMHGRIWVESTVGVGSSFLFTAKFGISEKSHVSSTSVIRNERHEVFSGAPAAASAHVLLADDSEDNRFLIIEYLRSTPHVLDVAENGEIALRKMQAQHYDLVLMDSHMPVMDGLTATRTMRAWEREQQRDPLPILALTADAFQKAAGESEAAGFNAHLTKPIAKSTLLQAIREYASPCDRPAAAAQTAPPAPQPTADVDPSIAALQPRYLANAAKSLAELQTAVAAMDYATMQRIGHNLHGTGGSFGFPRITDLGTALEQAAKDRDADRTSAAIAELSAYLGPLIAALS